MKIAVIIPTFNRPELLQRAVNSAFNQSRRPDEIIVVNDGDKVEVSWKPGLKIIHTQGRQGCAAARNLGIKNTDCEAIMYVDDDDELCQNHVEEHAKTLESGSYFCFSKALFKYSNGFETEDPEPSNHNPNKAYYDPQKLLNQNIAPISSFGHVKTAWKQIGCWDANLIRMEDWDFWGRMFIEFGAPAKIDKVTNIIHKGTANNMTDSNRFVYSMTCSWGDIVRDRLRFLASKRTGKITEEERLKFHIPKVGVIMPIYNASPFLERSISSILDQTFTDFEIIAVNDGSTDDSLQILEVLASKDNRIRIFNQSNQGVTKALNYGVLLSRSIYIARMDADDVSHKERFAKQVKFLDENKDVHILGSCFYSMNSSLEHEIWKNDVEKDPETISNTLLEKCCIGHPTVMMRRQVLENLNGYSEAEEHRYVEDYELWLRASKKFKIANLPDYLLLHRTHDMQVSSVSLIMQKANSERLKEKYRSNK